MLPLRWAELAWRHKQPDVVRSMPYMQARVGVYAMYSVMSPHSSVGRTALRLVLTGGFELHLRCNFATEAVVHCSNKTFQITGD